MWYKRIVLIIIVVFVGIQFIPTNRNTSTKLLETDVSKSFYIPKKVQKIFQNSCYDCHSNNTVYPWYNKIQPISFLMENHIKNGKKELNFSNFGAYSKRKQKSKLKGIYNQIRDNEMPLFSYTLIHRNAILSNEDKILIKKWTKQLLDSL
jgi:uncharacterized membrane protein